MPTKTSTLPVVILAVELTDDEQALMAALLGCLGPSNKVEADVNGSEMTFFGRNGGRTRQSSMLEAAIRTMGQLGWSKVSSDLADKVFLATGC